MANRKTVRGGHSQPSVYEGSIEPNPVYLELRNGIRILLQDISSNTSHVVYGVDPSLKLQLIVVDEPSLATAQTTHGAGFKYPVQHPSGATGTKHVSRESDETQASSDSIFQTSMMLMDLTETR